MARAGRAGAEPPALRARLRAATAPLHDRLDREVAVACLGDPPDAARLLTMHHAALCALVPALEQAGAARLLPGWEGRSRLAALEADLAELGVTVPLLRLAEPRLPADPATWGALYALEGSRLGNRVVLRRLQEGRGLPGGRAARFLSHRPAAAAEWPRVLERLESLGCGEAGFAAVAAGAEAVFLTYLAAVAVAGAGRASGPCGVSRGGTRGQAEGAAALRQPLGDPAP